ncbi:hypothetical protein CR513_23626, partial [Mucuna pruriens]
MFEVNRKSNAVILRTRHQVVPTYYQVVEGEADGKPWYHDIRNYLKNKEYLSGAIENNKRTLRRMAMGYLLNGDVLYKRSPDMTLLRCVDTQEAKEILEEIYEGVFGTHASGPKVASYPSVTRNVVVKFIKKNIVCRYDIPSYVITDNGTNLNNKMMTELWEQFKIRHHNSTHYRPKVNGAVESANKNIKKIVQKMVVTYKDWHETLPFALHGYRTTIRTSTGATTYSMCMARRQSYLLK